MRGAGGLLQKAAVRLDIPEDALVSRAAGDSHRRQRGVRGESPGTAGLQRRADRSGRRPGCGCASWVPAWSCGA